MTTANSQLIRSLYEAFARGDAGAVLGALDSRVEWNEAENIEYADGNPYIGPQRVGEGIFGRLMAEWDNFAVTPQQFVSEGDIVVATGRYRGTYKATGTNIDSQFVHVWTVRGRKVFAFQQYTDTLQFARAIHGVAAV
jgi:ketosteroid isomerase-like protein